MITYSLTFIAGFVVGALVFRNNTAKGNAFVDVAKVKAEAAIKEAKANLSRLKK